MMEEVLGSNEIVSVDKKSRNRMWLIYGLRMALLTITLHLDLLMLIAGEELGSSSLLGLIISMVYTVVVLGVSSGSPSVRKVAAVLSIFWVIWMVMTVVSSASYFVILLSVIELASAALAAFTLFADKRVNAYLDTLIKPKDIDLNSGETEEDPNEE